MHYFSYFELPLNKMSNKTTTTKLDLNSEMIVFIMSYSFTVFF